MGTYSIQRRRVLGVEKRVENGIWRVSGDETRMRFVHVRAVC
jgi:hypothetical protein